MAKYTEEVTHVFYSCKECPFAETLWQDDGFGIGREKCGIKCKKGYFEQRKDYNALNSCIPPYCEFSDKKKTGKESLYELTDLTTQELICLFDYVKTIEEKEPYAVCFPYIRR